MHSFMCICYICSTKWNSMVLTISLSFSFLSPLSSWVCLESTIIGEGTMKRKKRCKIKLAFIGTTYAWKDKYQFTMLPQSLSLHNVTNLTVSCLRKSKNQQENIKVNKVLHTSKMQYISPTFFQGSLLCRLYGKIVCVFLYMNK